MGQGTSAIISAGSSIMGGLERRRAAREQAMAADYRAKIYGLRADQAGAEGARNTEQTLQAIKAIRSRRGLSADSPTAAAIRAATRRRGAEATNNAVLSQLLGQDAERNEASGLRRASNWYAVKGFADAAVTLGNAGDDIGKLFGGGGG